MNSSPSSNSLGNALPFLYVAAILISAGDTSHAKSNTEVYVTKAKSVVIEKDKIAIVVEAEATRINLFAPPKKIEKRPEAKSPDGTRDVGTDSSKIPIGYTSARIFIIRKPVLKFNDPNGIHGRERAQYQKTLDDAWEMSLKEADNLRAGKTVGRIGYYHPTVLPDSIDGFGYLYPASHQEAEPDGADRPATADISPGTAV
jgi:hypothetical protein